MFQSTLLKRTMSLVVLSLVASAILATIAFIVAGRSATISIELRQCLKIRIPNYKRSFQHIRNILKIPISDTISSVQVTQQDTTIILST